MIPTNFVTINPTENSYSFDMHPDQGVAGVWFGSPTTGGPLLAYSLFQAQFTTGHSGRCHFRPYRRRHSSHLRGRCRRPPRSPTSTDTPSTPLSDSAAPKAFVKMPTADRQDALRSTGPRAALPASSMSFNRLHGKRVNTDPATRIPSMARVPLHHSSSTRFASLAGKRSG